MDDNPTRHHAKLLMVKPLEWKKVSGKDVHSFTATAMGLTYEATERPEGGAFSKFPNDRFSLGADDAGGIEEAMADAQVDFEYRLRSWVSPVPPLIGEAAIQKTAIAMWQEEARQRGEPELAETRTAVSWVEQDAKTRSMWIAYAHAAMAALRR